jgi:hypothetical protein
MTVLDKAISRTYREQELMQLSAALSTILGTVAVLAAPLNRLAMSQLIARPVDTVNKALLGLHSILAIPDVVTQPIQLHHASFRDFLIDIRRCNDARFSVDGKLEHKTLAGHCLRIMANSLRTDICDLRAPGVRLSHIDRRLIEQRLPSSLQYACYYWTHHVGQAAEAFEDHHEILAFLQKHLLHWLEALSLLEKLPEVVLVLGSLEQLTVGASATSCVRPC